MAHELGLPVPPGFVVTTEACRYYLDGAWPEGLDEELHQRMDRLGEQVGRRVWGCGRSAVGQRAVGRAGVDARHDGHGLEPGPDGHDDRRLRPGDGVDRLCCRLQPTAGRGLAGGLDGAFDAAAVSPYLDFLAGHGLDGVLVLGTTGEGVMFPPARRAEIAEAFVEAAAGRLQVAVHVGAQTTHDTVALAARAAEAGADAVAVIAPPYFALDEEELLAHFVAAAAACSPVPFYLYEFEARSGYAIPVAVVERLREQAPTSPA